MAGKDKYASFAELCGGETEGSDYRVCMTPVEASTVAILAPHGGKFEFLTSRLAASIAADDHHLYAFEGLKEEGNADLHITSSQFDEPLALDLVARCDRVLTIHGLGADDREIHVGGRDTDLRDRINASLCDAGFESKVVSTGRYAGIHPRNICNRGRSEAGVQIEIQFGLRVDLYKHPERYDAFVDAVRRAIVTGG